MVVFAHGWKNNAAINNANVDMFRETLNQLGAAEANQPRSAKGRRDLRGVARVVRRDGAVQRNEFLVTQEHGAQGRRNGAG